MNRRDFVAAVVSTLGIVPACRAHNPAATWRAAVAAVDITPDRPLWMAGFARRTEAAQGVALPLHAKALALQAGQEPPAVLVTADLLGLTARITDAVAAVVERRHRIPRSHLLFNASHTHCGPVVDEQLSVAYDLSAEQWQAIREYTAELEDKLVSVIGEAVSRLRPASAAYATGEVRFARNRRMAFTPEGPVDHTVPVLRVDSSGGSRMAVVFGYACHNTTLQHDFVQYHGDYAGVAQALLEEQYPGATALFVSGCGADVNPHPRGTIELVEAHGRALAKAVDQALGNATDIQPALAATYGSVDLPFAEADARDRWKQQLDIDEVYLRRHAAVMAQLVTRKGREPSAQRMPVQTWQFGGAGGADPPNAEDSKTGQSLTLIALGGEVVVDYALRLARDYPDRRIWAAGYSNDVFGYVPSLRVLREGGYEGGDAMIYYGRPGPFTEAVEELIVSDIRRQIG